MSTRFGLAMLALASASVASGRTVAAQAGTVSITGTLSGAQPLLVQVGGAPAYVTVFVVGRHSGFNPIQLLRAEGGSMYVPAGGTYRPRALTTTEKQRFGLADEAVIVAITSLAAPSMSVVMREARQDDLLLLPDSAVGTSFQLVRNLAAMLLPANAPYSAALKQDIVAFASAPWMEESSTRPVAAVMPDLIYPPLAASRRCGPDGLLAGQFGSLSDLALYNNAANAAVDFASGGIPVDPSGGVTWRYAGTQLRGDGCVEFTVIPVPSPYLPLLRSAPRFPRDTAVTAIAPAAPETTVHVRSWRADSRYDQPVAPIVPAREQSAAPLYPRDQPLAPQFPTRANQPVAPIHPQRPEPSSAPPIPDRGPDRAPEPARMPEPVRMLEPVRMPEPARMPEPVRMPEPAPMPSPDRPPVPASPDPVRIPDAAHVVDGAARSSQQRQNATSLRS